MKKLFLLSLCSLFMIHADPQEDLWKAAESGNLEGVRIAVQQGADINNQYQSGWTALMVAAQKGHAEIVKALIDARADVNKENKLGGTALIVAAQEGHAEIVKALIDAEADINKEDSMGRTAWMIAAGKGHAKIVNVLIAAEADVNKQNKSGWTALMVAALEGHGGVVHALIAAEADVNKENLLGGTALMFAVGKGHAKIVNALIAAGTDVNKQDKFGWTALMFAAHGGHAKIVNALIAAGAQIADPLKENALIKAAVQNLEQVSQAFFNFIQGKVLTSPAQKKVLLDQGYGIIGNLAVPAKAMVLKKVKELKKKGYRITVLRNKAGNSVLHTVAWYLSPQSDVAKFFIFYYPALMNKVNKRGITPFQAAVDAGPEMTKLFVEGMAAMPDVWKKKLWDSLSARDRQEAKAIKDIIVHGEASEPLKNGEVISFD